LCGKKIAQCERRIVSAKAMFQSFGVELAELSPVEKRRYEQVGQKKGALTFSFMLNHIELFMKLTRSIAGYCACEQKAADHEREMNSLKERLQWAKTEQGRHELMGAAASGGGARSRRDPATMGTGELVQAGLDLQDDSLGSLGRGKRIVSQTEEIGRETGTKLKEQTEQLNVMSEDLDRIESTLKRADRELRAFIRRMATDKLIMGFLLLIVLLIAVAVIYTAIKGKDKNKDSS
jgi:hypothetical protein